MENLSMNCSHRYGVFQSNDKIVCAKYCRISKDILLQVHLIYKYFITQHCPPISKEKNYFNCLLECIDVSQILFTIPKRTLGKCRVIRWMLSPLTTFNTVLSICVNVVHTSASDTSLLHTNVDIKMANTSNNYSAPKTRSKTYEYERHQWRFI